MASLLPAQEKKKTDAGFITDSASFYTKPASLKLILDGYADSDAVLIVESRSETISLTKSEIMDALRPPIL